MVQAARLESGPGTAVRPDRLERVASTSCSLLITGATGVGKEHLARWVHDHSPRASGEFIPVNCGALPEDIIDSHLFGHVRGAFSDAHADHEGLIRAAEGGTLLLDEIGELPPSAQCRLLRVLEEREVQPVGAATPVPVNVRIIAATSMDLSELVRRGRFRLDLYYRLNVIHVHLDPLRRRRREIPALIAEFNGEFARKLGVEPLTFAPPALRRLRQSPWPGNVRQLRTVIERLHVLCTHRHITVADLCEFARLDDAAAHASGRRRGARDLRLTTVEEALRACDGCISRAAESLGVHRSTVHRWLAAERIPA